MARKSKLLAMYSVRSVSTLNTGNHLACSAMLTAYVMVILVMYVLH